MTRLQLPELHEYIRSIDAADYARNRNYVGSSTRLSEYITRGAISLPQVRSLILENNTPESSYKLVNELAWSEYWHSVWSVKGDGIFDYIRPIGDRRLGIPAAVASAATGIAVLDDGIRQLQQTGYIHNHMRMWLAGLICNVAQCDWRAGADWMHSYLVDGDYASNHLSWQWVAGSYTGKPYLPQQDNINTYTRSNQQGTYLDQPYEAIADMAIPDALIETDTRPTIHQSELPESTIATEALSEEKNILLYSPWTLDPRWHAESAATRLLLIDPAMYSSGAFSSNVINSIMWFAGQIPGLKILCDSPDSIKDVPATIVRKRYTGIKAWPGRVEPEELLFDQVPEKFYPSFSAYRKQVQKTA